MRHALDIHADDSYDLLIRQTAMQEEAPMCTDSVSHLVLQDGRIQALLMDPRLDIVHKQVVLSLYSLNGSPTLTELEQILTVYLGQDWAQCMDILRSIEAVGIIRLQGERVTMVYPVTKPADGAGCGCG
jgi:hypothetical protein